MANARLSSTFKPWDVIAVAILNALLAFTSVFSSGYLRPAIAKVLLITESYHSRFAPPERIADIASVAISLAIVLLSLGLSTLSNGTPDRLRSSCKNWTTSGRPPTLSASNCSTPALPVWWIRDVDANSSGVNSISSATLLMIFSYLGSMLGFSKPLVVFLRLAFSASVPAVVPRNSPRCALPKMSSADSNPLRMMALRKALKKSFKRFNMEAIMPPGALDVAKSANASAIASSLISSGVNPSLT